jgi:thiol-disulfide isomerase/thioredoxin
MLKAADFTVKDLQGRPIHLAELLKKGPVYLNFWTSWCGPCKREMPELDRIHKTYRDRGFAVVAIAQDNSRSVAMVKPYITSNKFEFFAATDAAMSVGNLYNVRVYPTSFMIKQDGTIAYFAQGYLPGDEKKIEKLVRELLGVGTGEQAPDATK